MNVVFIFNDFALHNHIIDAYCDARPDDSISIVKVRLVLRGKSRTDTAGRILPQLSKRFIWSKLKECLVVTVIALVPKLLGRGAVFRRLRSLAAKRGLAFHLSSDVMSPETRAFIAEKQPDVIVTSFHQIVRRELLELPRIGIVNLHPGLLPDFRGIQPYFWELMEGFGKAGPTLHLIDDESVDTGRILSRASFKTSATMSVQLAYYLTACCAARLLPKTLKELAAGSLLPQRQESGTGKYYRWPDSAAVTALYQRGHAIVSWTDLFAILTGAYDEFVPESVELSGLPAVGTD